MKITLTKDEKRDIEARHKVERDGRVKDRYKVILLRSEGWTNKQIAKPLRIHEDTVSQHVHDWCYQHKIKPENGGSSERLTDSQSNELKAYLNEVTHTKVEEICLLVQQRYQILYSKSGMTKWLGNNGFSYKKPKGVPAKADLAKQEAFIAAYLELQAKTGDNEPVLFVDSVHPTMATKLSYGWIKTGRDKLIKQTASRTRENIIGAINLSTMQVMTEHHATVNADSIICFLKLVATHYVSAHTIHIILDNAGYHRSKAVTDYASNHNIILHYLPAYSPNLNPIERLWKVMNEHVRNNRCFKTPAEFKKAIRDFFEDKWPMLSQKYRDRINDNFQVIAPVS
jgi:transposase